MASKFKQHKNKPQFDEKWIWMGTSSVCMLVKEIGEKSIITNWMNCTIIIVLTELLKASIFFSVFLSFLFYSHSEKERQRKIFESFSHWTCVRAFAPQPNTLTDMNHKWWLMIADLSRGKQKRPAAISIDHQEKVSKTFCLYSFFRETFCMFLSFAPFQIDQ